MGYRLVVLMAVLLLKKLERVQRKPLARRKDTANPAVCKHADAILVANLARIPKKITLGSPMSGRCLVGEPQGSVEGDDGGSSIVDEEAALHEVLAAESAFSQDLDATSRAEPETLARRKRGAISTKVIQQRPARANSRKMLRGEATARRSTTSTSSLLKFSPGTARRNAAWQAMEATMEPGRVEKESEWNNA